MSRNTLLIKNRVVKTVLLIILCSIGFLLYFTDTYSFTEYKSSRYDVRNIQSNQLMSHKDQLERFMQNRKVRTTSNLGSILFKFENVSKYNRHEEKKFVVLVWKYWGWLKNRHVYNYGSSRTDALEDCSVKNCFFTGNSELLTAADAVLIHIQKGEIPKLKYRNPRQRWIFLSDESPRNAFSMSKKRVTWENFTDVFNWSMTYRSDADVPVPYGRTIPLSKPYNPGLSELADVTSLIPNWDRKNYDVLATVLISHCNVKRRTNFLRDLKTYMKVDIFGACADDKENKNRCPGHFKSDCEPISEYLFYLVLENSMCTQYLTEKIFYHAYLKGAIPVIMGPSIEDCESLLPPNSYIYVYNDTNIEHLAKHLIAISEDVNLLLSFHIWRNHFKVVNEHGYFGTRSYHLCRLCEALNYNEKEQKIYGKDEMKRIFDPSVSCY